MTKSSIESISKYHKAVGMVLFGLSAVESIIAAIALVLLPSDSSGSITLSPLRLILLAAILLPGVGSLVLLLPKTGNNSRTRFLAMLNRQPSLFTISFFTVGILLALVVFLLEDLFIGTGFFSYLAYAQRLAPVLFYFSLFSMQLAGYLIYLNYRKIKPLILSERPFLISWGITFTGLVGLVILIAATRLGLNADPIGWGTPTAPLLEWQIWLGVVICLLYRVLQDRPLFRRLVKWAKVYSRLSSWLITLAIWALAMLIWGTQPVPPGFFATPPRAPNYEIYPFSDAAFYDFHAQSLLIGEGYRGESIPPRPLYILFLAAAHLVTGQDYTRVILFQTAFLAFFPVIIYWITRKLTNSTAAILASLFIIFREWTSIISTPFTSDISNSKLLFADLPAALVISLVLLITLHWLQRPGKPLPGLLTGGILGVSLLVRTQIIILIPVIVVFYVLICWKDKLPIRSWLLPIVLFLFGFLLAVAPWLSRSYRITGQFVFDHPESQTRVMAQRYYPDVELTDFDRKAGESTGEYNQRLSASIRNQVLTHPDQVIHFIVSHFLNSEIANLQMFPVRFSITSISELVKPEHAFWEEWHGQASTRQLAVMLLNLAVLTAGAVYLVKLNTWLGILPLIFNLAYHFSNAAARNSGWRYLLPADWIFLIYFSAGLYAVIMFGTGLLGQSSKPSKVVNGHFPLFGLAATALAIFCIGYLPLFAERAIPRTYPMATVDNTRNILEVGSTSLSGEVRNGLVNLLEDPRVVVMYGRMLYPRFYGEKEGEEKTGKTGYTPLPYARYVFLVAGNPDGTVVFPNTRADLPLRNADDVILAGCMDGLAVKARLVILPGENPSAYSAEPSVGWSCTQTP